MKEKTKKTLPVVALLLLAPILGELLSGSSPPAEYFQPLTFLLLTLLYGTGALLIRETVRRWNKGWLAIFLMGMAYGIFEEGIMVRSFFDPTWGDLGLLATYGRWIGINWIWSIALTIFHAVVSISIPIALTELLFPKYRNTPWLGKRGYTISLILFAVNILLGPFFGMKITALGMIASSLSISLLVLLANIWTEDEDQVKTSIAPPQWKVILAGFTAMIGLIIGMWILPALSFPWLLTFIFLCIVPWTGYGWFKRLGMKIWSETECWAACFGLTLPWIILTVISEFENANRPDDTSGMILVAVLFTVFLLILKIRIRMRERLSQDIVT